MLKLKARLLVKVRCVLCSSSMKWVFFFFYVDEPHLFFIFHQGGSERNEGRDPCSSPPCKRLKQGNILIPTKYNFAKIFLAPTIVFQAIS